MTMGWREAIERLLAEVQGPLHYSQISEQILSRGYYNTEGATPDATVNAYISTSIKDEGDRSPFVRVGRGIYALRANTTAAGAASSRPGPAVIHGQPVAAAGSRAISDDAVETEQSIIRCLGMYWQRDLVVWRADPKLFGKQQAGSKPVNFSGQRALYILYDHHTVVYVGRSVDRPLGRRLFEHTTDRLGGRWNRFSWFGLLDVTDAGDLTEVPLRTTLAAMIGTFEALLIEALEPPQNRKRGDDFSVAEYIQDLDPELKARELEITLRNIEQKLRGQS